MFGVVLNAPEMVVYFEQHDEKFGVDPRHDGSEDDDQNPTGD